MARTHYRTPDHRLCQADFDHEILDGKILAMLDLDMGGRSLTNDMSAALQEVAKHERVRLAGFAVIYRDSDGRWDRVLLDGQGAFAGFAGLGRAVYDQDEALELLRAQIAEDGGQR